jgi:D-alanyl-D-alanine carboxypeptidase/D-alanyl-D-alanine-endopeptidase (penicillin-binding protein 4)
MNGRLLAPFFLLAIALCPARAEASPTATPKATPTALPEASAAVDLAFERYKSAIEQSGFSVDRQGFLFESLEGDPLLSCNAEQLFNPASVVKLATSAAAIERLGSEYRFPTTFYTNGGLDAATGELRGDLIVVGSGDPVFGVENAFLIARELRARGVSRVTGNFVVKGPFYVNYSTNTLASARIVMTALDPESWTGSIEAAFGRYRVQTGATGFEGVLIDGVVMGSQDLSVAGLTPLFTHRSMPLVKILKTLNNYSNNWMAHVVGWKVGGPTVVGDTVAFSYGVPRSSIRLASTSGLGSSVMRPMDVTRLLRVMVPRLSKLGYGPKDFLPVAGRDPGTLEDRYLAPGVTGSVVAKTGTLAGVSTLAGYMYTRNRGIVVFAIMNRGGRAHLFRRFQDQLVGDMLMAYGGPAPIPYARPAGYSDRVGAIIERAPGEIRPAPPADLVGGS